MIGALLAGVVAGLSIALPIGAIGTYLVALGARAPHRVGVAAALGVATTDGLYATLAVVGGSALQSVLRPAAGGLRWLSVAALVVLAGVTVRSGLLRYRHATEPIASRQGHPGPARVYGTMLGLTALNPATLAYFTALVLGHQAHTVASVGARGLFIAGAFGASAGWQLTLVSGGRLMGHIASGRRGQLTIALVSSAVMLALAGQVAARRG